MTEADVVAHVAAALDRGDGGWIVTPNVDILRQARRYPHAQALVAQASLVLADGMPLVWASRLAARRGHGPRLPERVAGSDLIWSLSAMAARDGRSIYLLGGAPGVNGGLSVPERAAEVLATRHPGLRLAGADSPPYGFDSTAGGIADAIAPVKAAKPDLVFVGLGFPRQERLIAQLVGELPGSWFIGCGASIAFVAGEVRRAPIWMRRAGLEWLHRLATEPRRLFTRYLIHDLPHATHLLTTALMGSTSPR